MTYQLEIFSALCSTKLFQINGIPAQSCDFGDQTDENPEDAPDYGCGNQKFTPFSFPDPAILQKYSITQEEFFEIAEKLAEGLSFGNCDWCA